MAKKLRAVLMSNVRTGPSWALEKATDHKGTGPVIVRNGINGSTVAIAVTTAMAVRLEYELEGLSASWFTAKEFSVRSSRELKDLQSGRTDMVFVLKNNVMAGVYVSPKLFRQLMESCPGLKKFKWPSDLTA